MRTILFMIFCLIPLSSFAQSDAIIGEYWTEDKTGKIAIYKCKSKYCGRISWRKENRKDLKNPDKNKRNRPVVGIEFLRDFTYNTHSQKWEGGSVYAIDNGYTYSGKMWLEEKGQLLKMRGYLGISILGRTASLERVRENGIN